MFAKSKSRNTVQYMERLHDREVEDLLEEIGSVFFSQPAAPRDTNIYLPEPQGTRPLSLALVLCKVIGRIVLARIK